MLVSLAIGDAYGFGFEYAPPEFVKAHNDLKGYVQHPGRPHIKPGVYSDDCQMAMGLGELFLSKVPRTNKMLWAYFINAFKRDPREGYAGHFYTLLKGSQNALDLMGKIQPHSNKSGGAMRAAPCGLLADPLAVIDTAVWQASVTHATRDGMTAAAASALLVWACRQGCSQGYLGSLINDLLPGYAWGEPWDAPVGSAGVEAVKAAITAVTFNDSMEAILHACIGFTGDVDTVAAIALPAAALHPDIEQNLSQELYDELEDGKYGKRYLAVLETKLMAAFPLVKAP